MTIKNIEVKLVWLAIGITLTGFSITIIGAFLNGLALFRGSTDWSQGFGLILMGDAIALSGVALITPIFLLSVYRLFYEDPKIAS